MNINSVLVGRGHHYLAELFLAAKDLRAIPTAGVIGGDMYINMEWFNTLTIRQMEAVLKHEALHIALNHTARCEKWGGDSKKAYNIAADAHINEYLQELRAIGGVFYDNLPDIGQDPRSLTTEELATALEGAVGELPDTHDVHGGGGGTISGGLKKSARGVAESLSEKEKGHIEKAFNTILSQQTGFPEITDEEKRIMSLIGNAWLSPLEPSYARPSRRALTSGFLLKGKAREFKKPIIDIYIDVSGSMADQAGKWVSFGSKLCKKYGGQLRISLWSDEVPAPSLVVPENFNSGGTNWGDLENTLNAFRPRGHKVVVITDMRGCREGQLRHADEVIKV